VLWYNAGKFGLIFTNLMSINSDLQDEEFGEDNKGIGLNPAKLLEVLPLRA